MSFGFGVGDLISVIKLSKDIHGRLANSQEQFQSISKSVVTLSSLLENVDDITVRTTLTFEQLKRFDEIGQHCRDTLEKLQETLDSYKDLKDPAARNSWSARFKQKRKQITWDQKDINEHQQRIILSINAFSLLLTQIAVIATSEAKAGVDELRQCESEKQKEKERKAILDWLSSKASSNGDLAKKHAAQQDDYFSSFCKGTGQKLFESAEFQTWLDQPDQVLLCSGIPGAGKTTTAAAVIDHLYNDAALHDQQNNVGIAFFYCNFRQQSEQFATDVFICLLQQLALSFISHQTKNLYERFQTQSNRPSFSEISGALRSTLQGFSKAFIIVDAVDEVHVDGWNNVVIPELLSLPANIFVTTRPIPEIKRLFKMSEKTLSLEITASDEDIRLYLDRCQLPACISRDAALEKEVKDEIVHSAKGMFLFARLHVTSLRGSTTAKEVRTELKHIRTGSASQEGSAAYDEAYERAFERVLGESVTPRHRRLARKALSWMVCARRPLTLRELRHGVAIEIDQEKLEAGDDVVFDETNLSPIQDILEVCAGLLMVDKERCVIRFVHYTTQEYLERTQGRWVPDAQRAVALACLSYLAAPNLAIPRNTSQQYTELRQTYALWSYAYRHWGHHVGCSLETTEKAAITYLRDRRRIEVAFGAVHYDNNSINQWGWKNAEIHTLHFLVHLGSKEIVRIWLQLGDGGKQINTLDLYRQTPLHYAVKRGDRAMSKCLLAMGANPDPRDVSVSPLYYACENGDGKLTKQLIASGANIDPQYLFVISPLCCAVFQVDEALVEQILAAIAPLDRKSFCKDPLLSAAHVGHVAILKRLLAFGGDPNLGTPIFEAIGSGSEAVLQELLTAGANPNFVRNSTTPLRHAIRKKNRAMVELLLASGADPHIAFEATPGGTRISPLLYAIFEGNEFIVKQLLASGAKLDFTTQDGTTLLDNAYRGSNGSDILKRLLVAGMDPNARGAKREPLHQATLNGDVDAVRHLLEFGADPNIHDGDGETPLSSLVSFIDDGRSPDYRKSDYDTIIQELLAAGADPGYRKLRNGRSLLHLVVDSNFNLAMRQLLLDGVSPNVKDMVGCSPLHIAARRGDEAVTEVLLDYGADPNAKDQCGRTPLHSIFENTLLKKRNEGTVRMLLAAKADPNSCDKWGRTPLEIAEVFSQNEAARLLFAELLI